MRRATLAFVTRGGIHAVGWVHPTQATRIVFDMIYPQKKNSEIVATTTTSNNNRIGTLQYSTEKLPFIASVSGMSDVSGGKFVGGTKHSHHSGGDTVSHDDTIITKQCATSLCNNNEERNSRLARWGYRGRALLSELWESTDLVFAGRGTVLLALGPVVILGNSIGALSEATCFGLAGMALIPCAERYVGLFYMLLIYHSSITADIFLFGHRLSFLTEQVAEHTNGTIGALLNATFGNAPELLISVAALRSGFYRVVQLTMLGSMITNMILVFGVSCLIGGLRWQVQDLRLTSGNVSVGMLLMATAGSLIPATLVLSGQFTSSASSSHSSSGHGRQLNRTILDTEAPSQEEVTLSRVNAAVMLFTYLCYIVFQLGTHKEEFDERMEERPAQPNVFCRSLFSKCCAMFSFGPWSTTTTAELLDPSSSIRKDSDGGLLKKRGSDHRLPLNHIHGSNMDEESLHDDDDEEEEALLLHHRSHAHLLEESLSESHSGGVLDRSERRQRRRRRAPVETTTRSSSSATTVFLPGGSPKKGGSRTGLSANKSFDSFLNDNEDHVSIIEEHTHHHPIPDQHASVYHPPLLSLHVGVIWLFIITLCVSAISDILVDTIDAFALRMNLSQVFTSMIIIPFFSNVAEQVSAFLFAYRNEMDLVVGVTIGSAIQIATFVLPGSVLIGYLLDRSMTLYFHSYETVCLLLCTLIVAAVLQGGTTNWLVGAMLLGVYIMLAAGIWFHEIENLSVDAEELIEAVH